MGFKQFLTNNWRLVNINHSFINRCANFHLESLTSYAQISADKKLQLPSKPKRPTPPFFQFLQEKRPEVIEKHNLNVKDAVRVVGEMWKNCDINTKKQFSEIYNKEFAKYKENIKLYYENLTDDQKNELSQEKYEQVEQKTRRKLKKELKELGKPSKPLTAYLMFVIEQLKNRGDISVISYMKIIGKKWKELDINTKTIYIEASLKENKKYYNDLIKWENDMAKAGRLDLIRPCAVSITDNN